MPAHADLILTLTASLAAALVFGLAMHRLGLSPLVGYLLAGVAVGPFTPGFVADHGAAEQFAEIGVVLLMFGVGLDFHASELLRVRFVAPLGVALQIGAAIALSSLLAHFNGWSLASGVVLGLCVSVASTVVLTRVLADQGVLHSSPGRVAVGWLVVEDLVTVLVLVLMPALAGPTERTPLEVAGLVGAAALKVGVLVALAATVGKRLVPALLARVAKTRSRELFTMTVLVLALGLALASATLFGASAALGAFLAGMIVGQSDFGARAASEALPMRDAFAVLFFVSIGMLFDPAALIDNLGPTLAITALVVLGKPLVATAWLRWNGKTPISALVVGLALGQIGEFTFILGGLGRRLGALPDAAVQVLVVASLVSISVNPILVGARDAIARLIHPRATLVYDNLGANEDMRERAVVVGFGPVGRRLVDSLVERRIIPVVIELNHDTVTELRQRNIAAVYGDANQPEILKSAGITHARTLLLTASNTSVANVIKLARELSTDLRVIARSQYEHELESIRAAGADHIVVAEAEVALSMANVVSSELGAPRRSTIETT